VHLLRELVQNQGLLKGVFESSEQAEDIFKDQQQRAHDNIVQARDIIEKIDNLTSLRATTGEVMSRSQNLEREWVQIEGEMYRTIQPFSLPALQSRLEYAANEAESLSEILAASFLEGASSINGDGENVTEFIRNYRRERKMYHLRKERLERWKEERVRVV
jgi:ESCRT-I complex subunit VPS37